MSSSVMSDEESTPMPPPTGSIYSWSAQDIPQIREGQLPSISPHASNIVHVAVSQLVHTMPEDFHVEPHPGPTSYDLASERGQIDYEIGRLRSIMLATNISIGRQVSSLCQRRNAIAPFNKLPLELVGIILGFVGDRETEGIDVLGLNRLASVSRMFWRAVKSSPGLWTEIHHESDAAVLLKLRKSGNLPLHIMETRYNHGSPNFLHLITPHCGRWGSASLKFTSPEELDHVREPLQTQVAQLKTLILRCTSLHQMVAPLELVQSGKLRRLELEGLVPAINPGALSAVQHLSLTEIVGVRPSELLDILASTIYLESLAVDSFQYAGDDESVPRLGPGLQLQKLKSLTLSNLTSTFADTILAGIHTMQLSALKVKAIAGDETQAPIFQRLIQRSTLQTAIRNSGSGVIQMSIDSDHYLKFVGKVADEASSLEPIVVSVVAGGWSSYLANMENFREFAASLPPVELILEEMDSDLFPGNLNFLLAMPTIISITAIYCPRAITVGLFRDVLSKEHSVGEEMVWACPNLTTIEIYRNGEVGDWPTLKPAVRHALAQRRRAIRQNPLPDILVKQWAYAGSSEEVLSMED